jgi:DNA ligase (NAD+)
VLFCINIGCRAKLKGTLQTFASKGAMDIDGLGPEIIETLVESGLVQDPADLYRLEINEWLRATREWSPTRVLCAFGIPDVGGVTCKKVASCFSSLEEIARASVDDLASVPGIKKFRAESIAKFFDDDENRRIIKQQDWAALPKVDKKIEENVLAAIEASKGRPLHRVLVALGIRNVGAALAEAVASHFHTMNAIMNASVRQLREIDGMGVVIAKSVVNFFSNESNRKIIEALRIAGINSLDDNNMGEKVKSDVLAGVTFVFTGSLEKMARDEAEGRVRDLGGRAASSISKNTDYLVAGTGGGTKRIKAQSLGIKIIDEIEFERLIVAAQSGIRIDELQTKNGKMSVEDESGNPHSGQARLFKD